LSELTALVARLNVEIDHHSQAMAKASSVVDARVCAAVSPPLSALADPTNGRFGDQVRRCVQIWCAVGLTTENAALLMVAAGQSAMQWALGADAAVVQTVATLRHLAAHLETEVQRDAD
jgi:hypothetical protein